MQVHVRLFATLREAAGWSERTVDVSEESSVGALLAQLNQQGALPGLSGRPFYVAVNQIYADVDRRLSPGDTVAIFPPVSGGRLSYKICRKRFGL